MIERQFDYVLVGIGSGNLFPLIHLVDTMKAGTKIAVVDKGKAPSEREEKGRASLLFGFAGAGLKSDGKMVFSPHPDKTSMNDEDRMYGHRIVRDIVSRFTEGLDVGVSHISNVNLDDSIRLGDCELELRQSEVIHIGTDNNEVFARRMYDYLLSKGVEFFWEWEVYRITEGGTVLATQNNVSWSEIEFRGKHVQISLGKTGTKFMKGVAERHKLAVGSGSVNFGMRVEYPMNPSIAKFVEEVQYDYKLYGLIEDNSSMRTFCTNNYSAYVIKEPIKLESGGSVVTFNGHAFGKDSKVNGMSNTAMLMRLEGLDETPDVYQERILSQLPKHGSYVTGRGFSPDAAWTVNTAKMAEFADIRDIEAIPDVIRFGMELFLSKIDEFFGLNGNYVAYVPEVKMASGTLETDENYRTKELPNVSFVGDCTSGAVGIVPSALTGLKGLKLI